MNDAVRVIDSAVECPEIPIVVGPGKAKVVIWPGSGSRYRTFHLIELDSGARTIPLSHESDSAYYIVNGAGSVVDLGTEERVDLVEGSMVHIDSGDRYQFVAASSGVTVLGGPCPADERLYASLARA